MQPPFTHAFVFSTIVLMAPSTTKKKTNPKPITPPPCTQRCGGGSAVKTMKFLAWHPPARHQVTQQKSPMVVTVNHSQPAKGEEEEEEGAN
jgi:hypothetical protein